MKLHAYLSLSRHGIYYFRWPLPDTRPNPHTEPNTARRTLRVSLRTRCPKEAGTLARRLAVCGDTITRHIEHSGMNYRELRTKVQGHFKKILERAKTRRDELGPYTADEKERLLDTLIYYEMDNEDYWELMGKKYATRQYQSFCKSIGVAQTQPVETKWAILDEIRKAEAGFYKALLEHNKTFETYDFTTSEKASEVPKSTPPPQHTGPTLSQAVEAYFTEQAKIANWTPGTVQKRRAGLAIAVEWFGADCGMNQIGKQEAAELKNAILSLPANRSKSAATQGLTLREAIALEDITRISNATVNSYLSTYKNFWAWAEAHGYATEALFQGLTIGKKGGQAKERKAYTQDALSKAYKALTEPESKFYKKESHRWATLIAMFSGARLNEVCQLELSDIRQEDGIWLFDITEDGEDKKRLKSDAAHRSVPIHSKLIELGLLEFVSKRRSAAHVRLFPDYTYSPKHGYGDKLSKWFNRTFTTSLGIKSDAHVFHGLRHTFATRLGQADVPTERIQFIVGHERQGVTQQVYMKEGYTPKQTKEAVERFAVNALDT